MSDQQLSEISEGIAKLQKSQEKTAEEVGSLRKQSGELTHTVSQIGDDLSKLRRSMDENFEDVRTSLKELKASARVLDRWLEEHLLERVQRLERAQNLQPYVHHQADDGE